MDIVQDNLTPQADNQTQTQTEQTVSQPAPVFSWKGRLSADVQKSPTLQKFDDTEEGFRKSVESYLNLEKLLGHDKVPVPKDANDAEGWARYRKAFNIPDKAEGYTLSDFKAPENLKDLTFDKIEFAQMASKYNLTPAQAEGLWKEYTQSSVDAVTDYNNQFQSNLTKSVNELKAEWGDAYTANVDLGQTVINKFSDSQETNDFITSTLASNPAGIKFLASIGKNFAENKVGEFSAKRYALSPDEARAEIDAITQDPNHPYLNERSSPELRQRAIDQVNELWKVALKGR